jgi:DNA-binding transcriptional MocR family regulator
MAGLEVMSPLVADRIWALPGGAASVKFFQYLVFRSGSGGVLPSQREMAREYKVAPSTISTLMEPLFERNLVLRSGGGERGGNRYRLHPLAAKYSSVDEMKAAFAKALADMREGRLPTLLLPEYQAVPPTEGGQPDLRIA